MKKNKMSRSPLFVALFAAYPVITLLASNIREVQVDVVIRPLLISLAFAFVLWGVIYAFQRNILKSALNTTAILFIFFIYGHLYQLIQYYQFLNWIGGPHVLLAILSVTYLFFTLRWTQSTKDYSTLVLGLNLIGAFLVIYPLIQIGVFFAQKEPPATSQKSTTSVTASTPDIYYIILDGYSRQDTLKSFGYDNSPFINGLQDAGFYVASCSRSNYRMTLLSLGSSLNLDYIFNAVPNKGQSDPSVEPVYHALQYNKVRELLKERGYQIVAFKTGYEWDEWRDADQFLAPPLEDNTALYPAILPFEHLLLKTTVMLPFMQNGFLAKEHYLDQFNRAHYILDELPKVASQPGPKFVYVHLLVPHAPFIFLPDGSMNPDTSYYITESGIGADDEHTLQGYLNNVKFISAQMLPVVKQVIANSSQPPIIIIQGDHGYVSEERKYNNLNAYYLPGEAKDKLYPTITPVNSFRLIFSEYFGMDFPLRADKSIGTDPGRPYRQRVEPAYPAECP